MDFDDLDDKINGLDDDMLGGDDLEEDYGSEYGDEMEMA